MTEETSSELCMFQGWASLTPTLLAGCPSQAPPHSMCTLSLSFPSLTQSNQPLPPVLPASAQWLGRGTRREKIFLYYGVALWQLGEPQ